jgi:radical SAM superfamily enzyme
MTTALKRNANVSAHQVTDHVWGLYNLTTGAHIFIDAVSYSLLTSAESYASRDEILAACRASVPAEVIAELNLDFDQRLTQLEEMGALLHGAEPIPGTEIVLVDPPVNDEHQVGMHGPSGGLSYLAAVVEQSGLGQVGILDMRSVCRTIGYDHAAHMSYFARHAGSLLAPRVLGITAVSSTIDSALFLAELARLFFPDCFIVLGGPHASFEWQSCLQVPAVDAVVRGEGEQTFPRLVERVLEDRTSDLSDLPGLAWRGPSGELLTSGWSPRVEDLDSLPIPDLHHNLLNSDDIKIDFPRIISTRSCPFACSFCSTSIYSGRRIRYRSVSSVIEEIVRYQERYGHTSFVFDDDSFTANRERTLEICGRLSSLPFAGDLSWGCNTRIDCIDEELIAALHEAGCRKILFGVESGDLEVRKQIGKGRSSLAGFDKKIELMQKLGISPELNFILGLPGESTETIDSTDELLTSFPNVACTFNFLTVYPGTPLEEQMTELGMTLVGEDNQTRYSLSAPTVNSPTLSAEDQLDAYLQLQWNRKRRIAAQEQQGC